MPWPTTPGFVRTNIDSGLDAPSVARGDIYNALTDLQSVINGRGQSNGVAPLDNTQRLPTDNLPVEIPQANLPVSQIGNDSIDYQTAGSYTFTVPDGVTRIKTWCAGAGGGGGYNNSTNHGGGGGAGGIAVRIWAVSPGDTISVVVGSGGQGGASPGPANGSDGGDSTVTVGVTTTTGKGGKGGLASPGYGGLGGIAALGKPNLQGGSGNTGTSNLGGIGGSNALSGAAPGNGTGWGFGGGGFGSGTGGPNPAHAGKDGGVMIEW